MQRLRSLLPVILQASGIVVALLFLVLAAVSVDNPLATAILFVAGIVAGALLFGAGYFLALAVETAARVRQIQGDVRSLGNACLELLQQRDK